MTILYSTLKLSGLASLSSWMIAIKSNEIEINLNSIHVSLIKSIYHSKRGSLLQAMIMKCVVLILLLIEPSTYKSRYRQNLIMRRTRRYNQSVILPESSKWEKLKINHQMNNDRHDDHDRHQETKHHERNQMKTEWMDEWSSRCLSDHDGPTNGAVIWSSSWCVGLKH